MVRSFRSPVEELQRIDRSMTPGTLDGRIAEARLIVSGGRDPNATELGGGDVRLDDVLEKVFFWQDRFICDRPGDQTFTLSHLPLEHSEHLYWGTVYQRGIMWSRSEDSKTVTVFDSEQDIKVGDVLTFEYSYTGIVEGVTKELEGLVLRGGDWGYLVDDGTLTIPLPAGTEEGDLIVVSFSSMTSLGGTSQAKITDGRLAKISHNTYIGSASNLNDIVATNPEDGGRLTVAVATFAGPIGIYEHSVVGPDFSSPMDCPSVVGQGAILCGTLEAPSGTSWDFTSVPASYSVAQHATDATSICEAAIWYIPPGTTIIEGDTIGYSNHASGLAWATCISLMGV